MPWWLWAAGCEHYAPEIDAPSAPLGGKHALLPCTECHSQWPYTVVVERVPCDETPGVLTDPCTDCHACQRPEDHFGQRSCGDGASCHADSDLLWRDADGGGDTGTGGSCAGACHGPARPDAAPTGDAHAAHLDAGSLWTGELGCDDCHPAGGASAGTHADGASDVALSAPLAAGLGGTLAPSYSGSTCSETWCHGAGLSVPAPPPGWRDGPSAVACGGDCHGWPPGGSHVQISACSGCHPPTGGDGQALADPSTHVDGTLQ